MLICTSSTYSDEGNLPFPGQVVFLLIDFKYEKSDTKDARSPEERIFPGNQTATECHRTLTLRYNSDLELYDTTRKKLVDET